MDKIKPKSTKSQAGYDAIADVDSPKKPTTSPLLKNSRQLDYESDNETTRDLDAHLDKEIGEEMPMEKGGSAGMASAIFNLVNTIIGGGTLALPYAFKQAGLVVGIGLTLLAFCLVLYSAKLIMWSSLTIRPRGVGSYKGVARAAFGKAGPLIVEIANTGFLLGAMVGYIVIIGKVLAPFLDKVNASRVIHYDIVTCLVTLLILYPLACLKTMNALRFTSFISVACIAFLVICIVIRAIQRFLHPVAGLGEIHLARFQMSLFSAIPVISFAFTFHPTLIPIWTEQSNRSEKKITKSLLIAVSICCFAYITTGVFGYLSFRDTTVDNILLNYPESDKLMDVVKASFLIIIISSFPVLTFPCREGIDKLLFTQPAPWWRRLILTFWLVGISLILAISVSNISIVFGFVGATVGQLVIYIFPSLFFIKLYNNVRPKYSSAYSELDTKTRYSSQRSMESDQVSLDEDSLGQVLSEAELEEVESLDYLYPDETRLARWKRKYGTLNKLPAYALILFGIIFGVVGVAEILMKKPDPNPTPQSGF